MRHLRDEVTKELADVSFDGVTGPVSFDEFGDTNNKVLTVYVIKNGKYVVGQTEAVK
jgi:branched-chain amino acid transport system substrate-binding protein